MIFRFQPFIFRGYYQPKLHALWHYDFREIPQIYHRFVFCWSPEKNWENHGKKPCLLPFKAFRLGGLGICHRGIEGRWKDEDFDLSHLFLEVPKKRLDVWISTWWSKKNQDSSIELGQVHGYRIFWSANPHFRKKHLWAGRIFLTFWCTLMYVVRWCFQDNPLNHLSLVYCFPGL